MKRLESSYCILLFALLVIGGCEAEGDKPDDHEHEEGEHREEEHQEEGHAGGDEREAEEVSSTVDVPVEGKEFEPPISVDEVPEEAWHCDMDGSVHYAAMKEGDGECPVCGMDLVQK